MKLMLSAPSCPNFYVSVLEPGTPACSRRLLQSSVLRHAFCVRPDALSLNLGGSAMLGRPRGSNPLSPVRGSDSKPAVAHLVIVNARIIELDRQCHNSR